MKKITYDVKFPLKCQDNGIYVQDFRDFYDSGHKNVCIEYDDTNTAIRAQKAMCMMRDRKRIYDLEITRRKNILYLIRTNKENVDFR